MATGTRNAATTEAGMTNRLKLSFLRLLAQHRELSPLIILVALCIAFSMGNASFFSALNLTNLLSILPELGIIALAMTLLLTTGEFDLSVGAVFALAPILLLLMVQSGVPLPVALALALAVSAAIGCLNGWLVTGMAITSFLVTLSMLLIVRGVALFITNGFPQKPLEDESWLRWMLSGGVDIGEFTIHASLLWFIALSVMCHYLLRRSKLGNWILATGSNGPAAIARGVPTAKVKTGLFALTSLFAGFAGILSALRISSASPIAGTGYELEVIAMVVVGGTALTGGLGTIIGTVIGVMLLRIIRNGIIMAGVPGLAYNIFVGVIILAMLIINSRLEKHIKLR
ncbi:inner-membrane translocator [Verminephrobacter eiseniae EF01-2]|uniref:Inner-membrane translocator n=2 Tax=Verminephrobacter eiseniae TaxID=364317 RepID=A1WNE5_VEREI|nr:inner-membrane translocator [Verminephrobacter eiseniae EF01-2]